MTDTMAAAPLFPFHRTRGPLDPPPVLRHWQRDEPIRQVMAGGVNAWLVTRYADVRELLADPRLSADSSKEGFPTHRPNQPPAPRGYLPAMDAPDHTRLKRIIIRSLANSVASLRPAITLDVNELLDEITQLPQPVDLVSQFALPLPLKIICRLFGVPYEDRAIFEGSAKVIASGSSTREDVAAAYASLTEYSRTLIALKEREPADDLLSEFVTEHVPMGRIRPEELVGLMRPLLTGGHATTTNQIALSTVALLRWPEQAALLMNNPELLPGAVNELIRHQTVVHFGIRRVATEDIPIGGMVIRAGEGVVLALHSANRDPDEYPDPDRLDITRSMRRHMGFGHGPHRCPGQALGRIELEIALPALFRRLPGLRLAEPLERIGFEEGNLLYGIRELPVFWGPARGSEGGDGSVR
jgi:cytochrome P450